MRGFDVWVLVYNFPMPHGHNQRRKRTFHRRDTEYAEVLIANSPTPRPPHPSVVKQSEFFVTKDFYNLVYTTKGKIRVIGCAE